MGCNRRSGSHHPHCSAWQAACTPRLQSEDLSRGSSLLLASIHCLSHVNMPAWLLCARGPAWKVVARENERGPSTSVAVRGGQFDTQRFEADNHISDLVCCD